MYKDVGLKNDGGFQPKSCVKPAPIRKLVVEQTPAHVARKRRKINSESLVHRRVYRVEGKLFDKRKKMKDTGLLTKESNDKKIRIAAIQLVTFGYKNGIVENLDLYYDLYSKDI